MPRSFTTDEMDLALGEDVTHHLFVYVEDADGVLQDCSDLGDLNLDLLDGTSFGESLDTPVSTGTLVIRRDTTYDSAAPTVGNSSINRNVLGDFAPLFEKGRDIFMKYALMPRGVAPTDVDKRPLFKGRIDGVHWHDNPMTIDISDIGAWVADAQIREAKQYADNTGTPGVGPLLGEMIQSMIDDAMPDSDITLDEPETAPFQPFSDTPQQPGSLLQAIRNWAQEIGWDLRYRWNSADEFVLSLFEPPRTKNTADWTLGPSIYTKVGNLSSSIADVRNDIIVQYKDVDGNLQTVRAKDDASIAKYGGPGAVPRLWFIPTSAIRNGTDALAFAQAVLSDLKEPVVDQEIELPFFPFVQIGDMGAFLANDDHYDSDQLLAVVGYQHRFQNGEGVTTIQARGKVAGAYRAWIRKPGASSGIPSAPAVARPSITPILHDDTHNVDAVIDVAPLTSSIKVAASTTHLPTLSDVRAASPIATGGATRITVFDVIMALGEGVTGSISALAYNDAGAESPIASAVVSLPTSNGEAAPNIELVYASPDPITGLTVDVGLKITTVRGLGGTLRVWTNHDGTNTPNYAGPVEGSLAILSTPYVADETKNFIPASGIGTFQYLNDIVVHASQGKMIFAEFVDSEGRSSGQFSFVLNGGGGVVKADGTLKDASINLASQIANTMTLPSVYDTLPATGRTNEVALLTSDKHIYRWNGTAWKDDVDASDISGVLIGSQLADSTITLSKMSSDLAPPRVLSSLSTPSTGQQTALYNGELYRSNGSGGWTKAVQTVDLTGTISGPQIAPSAIDTSKLAPGAVTYTKIASGLTVPQVVSSIGAADSAISLLAYNTSDGYFYRWIGSSWTKTVQTSDLTGTITSTQITDGAISTPKIAANAVTATQIAAGAVTAGKLDVGAVTAGTVAAGAIGTAELAANAVTAVKISAGVITADKLFVYSSQGAALNPDPGMADATAWFDAARGLDALISNVGSSGKVGPFTITSQNNGAAYIEGKQYIPLDPNKVYRVRCWILNVGGNGVFYMGVRGYNANFTDTPQSGGGAFYSHGPITVPNNGLWQEYVGYFGKNQTTVASSTPGVTSMDPYTYGGAKWVRPYALLNYLGSAGYMLMSDFRIEEMAPATLIQDGAITTDKVAANAITAVKILAGAITTEKLLIASTGSALNADPELKDPSAWGLSGVSIVDLGTGGYSGNIAFRSTAGGGLGNVISTKSIPVDPLKIYRFRVMVRRLSGANGYLYYGGTFRNGDGTTSNDNGGYIYAAGSGTMPAVEGTWQEYSGTMGISTGELPSSAKYFYPILYLNYGSTAGYYEAQDFRVEEAIPSTLIKDGAITTQKMLANTINGDRITGNTLDANKIVAGSITTDRMTANTISGDRILGNSMDAGKIVAGSITTDRMTANTINGDRITGGTLNANKIVTGSLAALTATLDAVTAGVLSAGAITATAIHSGSISTGHIATITLSETAPNAGIIQIGKLRSVDGTRYLDLAATGGNPFLHHPLLNLNADGSAVFSGALSAASGTFSGTLSGANGTFTGTLSAASGSFAGDITGSSGTFYGALSGATGTFAGQLTASNVQLTGVDPANGTIIQMTAANLAAGAKISFYNTLTGYEAQIYSSGYFTNIVSPGGVVIESPGTVQVQATGGTLFLIGTNQLQIRGGSSSQAVLVINTYDSAAAFVVTKSDGTILFQVDEPTSNQDTGLSFRYRDTSGVYSLKRMGSDTVNSGGTGTRRLRIPN